MIEKFTIDIKSRDIQISICNYCSKNEIKSEKSFSVSRLIVHLYLSHYYVSHLLFVQLLYVIYKCHTINLDETIIMSYLNFGDTKEDAIQLFLTTNFRTLIKL